VLLARDLPQLPALLKLGSTTRTFPLKSGRLGGVQVQYGVALFRHSDGTLGELLAIRAYDRGSVVYLVGIIKDSQASSAHTDINALSAVLASAQFS
jgi:hypothetical protein